MKTKNKISPFSKNGAFKFRPHIQKLYEIQDKLGSRVSIKDFIGYAEELKEILRDGAIPKVKKHISGGALVKTAGHDLEELCASVEVKIKDAQTYAKNNGSDVLDENHSIVLNFSMFVFKVSEEFKHFEILTGEKQSLTSASASSFC